MPRIPTHPRDNPSLPDGIYDAVVHEVAEDTYGDNYPLIRIVLWLPAPQLHLTTVIHFPDGRCANASKRLWYFCASVGFEPRYLFITPDAFNRQPLQVELTTARTSYSAVNRFLPQNATTLRTGGPSGIDVLLTAPDI